MVAFHTRRNAIPKGEAIVWPGNITKWKKDIKK